MGAGLGDAGPAPSPTPPVSPARPTPPKAAARPIPPAPPLPPVADSSEEPGWRRPLLLALLVLVAGAALGGVAFALEQRYFVWKPDVAALPDGRWRVTGSGGTRPGAPVIAGGRLVWEQGAYVCVLDLRSGDAHVIGAAGRGWSVWPAAASESHIAWMEQPRDAALGRRNRLWVYDCRHGRRQSWTVEPRASAPAVAGDLVAWCAPSADDAPRIETLDVRSGRRGVLAEHPGIEEPVVASDGAVAWPVRSDDELAVVVRDVSSQTETSVVLAGPESTVDELHLAGRALVWTLTSGSGSRVLAYDLDTRRMSVVAQGTITATATDGRQVVWAEGETPSGEGAVHARSLAGGAEYTVGAAAAEPTSLAVGSGWVAWTFDDGGSTRLEASRVPR